MTEAGDPTCPYAETFDPLVEIGKSDPTKGWQALAGSPPTWNDHIGIVMPGAPKDGPSLLVSRHADVLEVLRDARMFTQVDEMNPPTPPVPEAGRHLFPDGWPIDRPMLFGAIPWARPPSRTIVTRFLTEANVKPRVAALERNAELLLDALPEHGSIDLMTSFARPYVVRVLAQVVLGLPEELLHDADIWIADQLAFFQSFLGVRVMEESEQLERLERAARFRDAIVRLSDERRRVPADDLLSELVASDDNGQPVVPEADVIPTVFHVLIALDQPVYMIGNLVVFLLSDQQRWEDLCVGRVDLPSALEEGFRLNPTLPMLIPRKAREDTHVAGVPVPGGTTIALHIGAANRDPNVFRAANEYRPERPESGEHLSFGRWSYYCIGNKLARTHTEIAIRALMERLPKLRLVDPHPPRALDMFSGPSTLEVTW
jgi:cytochrome P450